MKPFRLHRRTVLRGLGAGLALPALDAMRDDRGLLVGAAHAQAAKAPVRFVAFYFAYGCRRDYWLPTATGPGYELKAGLAPLADLKADFNLISGLNQSYLRANDGYAEHEHGSFGAFTGGVGIVKEGNGAPGKRWANGPSMEWVLGHALGKSTLHPALAVSLARSGVNFRFDNDASWMGPRQVAPDSQTPSQLAAKLMPQVGGADPVAAARARRRRSMLDFLRADAQRLHMQLGAADRARVDEHLTSVRELERQMDAAMTNQQACGGVPPAAPAGVIKDDIECMKLQAKLIAFAFKCDLTRYVSMNINVAQIRAGRTDPNDDHNTGHDNNAELILYYFQRKMTCLAILLNELRSTADGDKTLLYNSLVLTGTDVAVGAAHDHEDVITILAGQGGGQVKTGRHLRYRDKGTTSDPVYLKRSVAGAPVNDLQLAVMRYCGHDLPKWGIQSNGPLQGLDV